MKVELFNAQISISVMTVVAGVIILQAIFVLTCGAGSWPETGS